MNFHPLFLVQHSDLAQKDPTLRKSGSDLLRAKWLIFTPRVTLATQGGILTRLLPIFRLGLGGQLGSGLQWMPWIHIDDQVQLIDYLLQKNKCEGAFNACAPEIVRNVEFTQTLAKTLHRLAILRIPAWTLRLVLGEMSVLLLGGQRLVPHQTQSVGFVWRYPTLSAALLQLIA